MTKLQKYWQHKSLSYRKALARQMIKNAKRVRKQGFNLKYAPIYEKGAKNLLKGKRLTESQEFLALNSEEKLKKVM